jgi:hypothetical protein
MTLNRTAFFSIAAACVTSVTYVFSTGVDWTVAVRSGIVASSFVTALILSAWTCVPYLMLLPTAGRHGSPPFAIFALFCILAFGLYSMQQGRHEPGDEGGSYIVMPFQQLLCAIVILFAWFGMRGVRALRIKR